MGELKGIKQSYCDACATVDFLQKTAAPGPLFYYQLGFYRLFTEQKERARLEEIARSQLGALIGADRAKGTYFLKTMERYFFHGGNLRATADDLHIHINTLRYRLKVLKNTFHIDLATEKCRFDTYFAIKTLSFLCPGLFKPG